MRRARLAGLFLAALPLLAGCGDFWQAPSTTTTTTTSSLSSGIFYVLNQQTLQVAAYSIVTGTLTQVSGSPYALASAPLSMAVSPNGDFLYVGTASGIYVYAISSTGALTLKNGSAVISSDLATTMQVDATGAWLLEAGPNAAVLFAIPISSTTGLPTATKEQMLTLPAATVQQLVISPDNTHIFVALGSSGTEVAVFAAGEADPFGNEVNIPVVNAAGAALSVGVDPSNRLFYIGETAAVTGTNSGGLRAFNYNSLDEVTGSPYSTGGLAPASILPASGGTYVFVANRTVSGSTTGDIASYSFTSTGTTYSLTALSTTAAAGTTPVALAEDSLGNYVLVVNSGGNPDLEAYTFDSTTGGKLDSAITSATGTDPVKASAVAAVP